jgi:hypothetical protein
MLVDLREDSAAWQAEKMKQKLGKAAAATEEAYPGKQQDLSYQKYRFQLGYPGKSHGWIERGQSPTYSRNEEMNVPSLQSDLASSASALSNLSANREPKPGTDTSHVHRNPTGQPMNSALEGGNHPNGQSTVAREVVPKHDSLQGPGLGADERTFKSRDASAAGTQCAHN